MALATKQICFYDLNANIIDYISDADAIHYCICPINMFDNKYQ